MAEFFRKNIFDDCSCPDYFFIKILKGLYNLQQLLQSPMNFGFGAPLAFPSNLRLLDLTQVMYV